MKVLYHGSHTEVSAPLAKVGRRNLDFGQGFYLTSIKQQAENWATIVSSRRGRNTVGKVSVFRFNESKAVTDGVRFKRFEVYDIEWLDYVVDCRRGRDVSSEYDIIEGGVANDNVIDTVEDYEKGVITAEQALGQLRYKDVNHQICILNQQVIDCYLEFVECIIIQPEEDER